MNIYAFGDIHGEYFKLRDLVMKLNIGYKDILVFLGDYVDRGNMSFEVIELLLRLKKDYNCIFIKGNHDLMLMNCFKIGKPPFNEDYCGTLLFNGGQNTLESYEKYGYEYGQMPDRHRMFFESLIPYYETEDFIFVHAGIVPGVPLDQIDEDDLYWSRDFYRNNEYKGKTVVFGHTRAENYINEESRICIDTGACYRQYGTLTCVRLPDRIFIQQR